MRDNGNIQLAVYTCKYRGGPIASVRYTSYGKDGRVINVEQINYGATAEQLAKFDYDATNALEIGVDVSIITRADVEMFPKISYYTKL